MSNVFNIGAVSRQLQTGGEPPDNAGMEERVAKLEAIADKTSERLGAIEKDVAVIKTQMDSFGIHFATKADLHKAISEQTWKVITWMTGISAALVGATYFIAKFVK